MTIEEKKIIRKALSILNKQFKAKDFYIKQPKDAVNFFRLKLSLLDAEVFGILFLNTQNQVICFEKLFYGTINASTVYPREVVKRVLALNATSIILVHNHPSGNPEPSHEDETLTRGLANLLGMMDVQVMDHIIVAGNSYVSLADRRLFNAYF